MSDTTPTERRDEAEATGAVATEGRVEPPEGDPPRWEWVLDHPATPTEGGDAVPRADDTAHLATEAPLAEPSGRAPAQPPGFPPGRPEAADVPPAPPAAPPPLPPAPPAGPQAQPGPSRPSGWRPGLIGGLAGALVGALVAGGLVAVAERDTTDPSPRPVEVSAGQPDPAASQLAGEPLDIRGVLERVQPSVVSIETGQARGGGLYGAGAGSGVIISADGLVLTNAHVIEGADAIQVKLFDGTSLQADLVGSSPADDVALIRVRGGESLQPADLGSSDALQVGDEVVAIGNALNLEGTPTVTTGIVSATGRSIGTDGASLQNLIQTDAAINPGNSGGALVNVAGEVVGINTAIIGDAQNIGFAIAIDPIRSLIEELRQGSGQTRASAFLGVSTVPLDSVDPSVLDNFGITTDQGALVAEVVPNSAADEAGLQPGDVITAVDGEEITANSQVGDIVRAKEPGESITIEFERQGDTQTTTAELGSRQTAN
ncbi:MAG: trypsin-like peptidase domain-containing protein [Acidimicrobiales bacterium]|nr:trypsin-like peptidase domain-containing protein [Acidimicrobiales bacterium]